MSDLDHLHPVFRARVLATGVPINSGARSHAGQSALFVCFQGRLATGHCGCAECNSANSPGTSWHEFDEANPWPPADGEASQLVGGPWALAVDFAEPYPHDAPGLCFPIAGEPWHAQPTEVTEPQRVVGAWRRLPGPRERGELFGGLGQPEPDPPVPQLPKEENEMPVLFWHQNALYLLSGGHRSASGLQPHTCDALIAAGAKVVGASGDDSELFQLLPTF